MKAVERQIIGRQELIERLRLTHHKAPNHALRRLSAQHGLKTFTVGRERFAYLEDLEDFFARRRELASRN